MQREIHRPRQAGECEMCDLDVGGDVGEGHSGFEELVVGGVEGVDGLVGGVEDAEAGVFPAVVTGYMQKQAIGIRRRCGVERRSVGGEEVFVVDVLFGGEG